MFTVISVVTTPVTRTTKKVLEDGGLMFNTQQGWHIECPQGHNGDEIHMD